MTHRPARCASRPGRSWRFAAYAGLAFAIASASAACDAVLDIQEYPAGSVADASLDDATLADTEGHDTGRTDAPVSDAQADVTDAAHEDTRGPDAAADASAREGWIQFGEPNFDARIRNPVRRTEQPVPGKLVLFPSYMWHGTLPFHSKQSRTTIAFDVVPR